MLRVPGAPTPPRRSWPDTENGTNHGSCDDPDSSIQRRGGAAPDPEPLTVRNVGAVARARSPLRPPGRDAGDRELDRRLLGTGHRPSVGQPTKARSRV